MKKWAPLLVFFISSCAKQKHPIDPVSCYKGYTFWKNLTDSSSFPYDADQVIAGIRIAASDQALPVHEEEVVALLHQFQVDQNKKNLVAAEQFLRTVAEDSVEVIPSKLYYKQMKQGKGAPFSDAEAIDVTYKVSILQNDSLEEVFASGNNPVRLQMEDTILGFSQGAAGLLIGEKRAIYIHPELNTGRNPEFLNKLIIIEVERQ